MFDDNSDRQLMDSLKLGDESAMTEIYNRYWRKMLAIAYNFTRDKSASEEIVQEVFVKLWDRRNSTNIVSLPNYLAVAIKYSVFTYLSREKRRNEVAANFVPTVGHNFDDEEIYAQFLKEYIDGVVDKLPEKCKLVFKFSRENGKSIPQIANELSISEKTVEAHLTKALKSIKYSLKNTGIPMLFLVLLFSK